jgi:hypothetical protein
LTPFQKTAIITPKKRTVQPGNAFEDTAFNAGFEIVKFQTKLQSFISSFLCNIDANNGFLTLSSIRQGLFPVTYSKTLFPFWKENRRLKSSLKLRTPENVRL